MTGKLDIQKCPFCKFPMNLFRKFIINSYLNRTQYKSHSLSVIIFRQAVRVNNDVRIYHHYADVITVEMNFII